MLADNRYPAFVQPICEAARRRKMPVVLDGDRPTDEDDPLFRIATHVIFSSECLRATTGVADLAAGLERIARKTDAFLAVSNGPNDIVFLEGGKLCQLPVFADRARSIRSAPATPFTAASRWRLAEGRSEVEAMRFGAAVAGIKCSRLGGSAGVADPGRSRGVSGGALSHCRIAAGSPAFRGRLCRLI